MQEATTRRVETKHDEKERRRRRPTAAATRMGRADMRRITASFVEKARLPVVGVSFDTLSSSLLVLLASQPVVAVRVIRIGSQGF